MKMIVDQAASDLAPTSPAALEAAGAGPRTRAWHDHCAFMVPALDLLHLVQPAHARPVGPSLSVAAWNAERCLHMAPSIRLLQLVDADVVLLTEVDYGMARAQNLHTTAEMASALGAGFVYGVEFVETGRGNARESAMHPHLDNSHGFHGNAILSRHALADAFMVRLDDGAVWFEGPNGMSELRLGGRNAIVARLADAPTPLWVASVHLESSTDAADRAAQVARLLGVIADRCGDAAMVMGGDFNTNSFRGAPDPVAAWRAPETSEPLFTHLRAAGFAWDAINAQDATQRTHPHGWPPAPHTRLDWLFARGLAGAEARTAPAVDANGDAISDHDLVMAKFALTGV